MKKLFFVVSILCASASLSCYAQANEKVYLKCTPDPNEKLPGGVDILLDKAKLEGYIMPISQTWKFRETETEYINRSDVDGKMTFLFAINKFTLRYRSYNVAAAIVNADPNLAGQCIIQDRKL